MQNNFSFAVVLHSFHHARTCSFLLLMASGVFITINISQLHGSNTILGTLRMFGLVTRYLEDGCSGAPESYQYLGLNVCQSDFNPPTIIALVNETHYSRTLFGDDDTTCSGSSVGVVIEQGNQCRGSSFYFISLGSTPPTSGLVAFYHYDSCSSKNLISAYYTTTNCNRIQVNIIHKEAKEKE